jgi:hypothetical protein
VSIIKRHGRSHITVNSANCGLIPRRFTSRTVFYDKTSVIVGITHQPDATLLADFPHGSLHDAACHDEQPLSAIYKRKQWIRAWITVGIQARPCQICQSVHLVLTLLRNVINWGYKNQKFDKKLNLTIVVQWLQLKKEIVFVREDYKLLRLVNSSSCSRWHETMANELDLVTLIRLD